MSAKKGRIDLDNPLSSAGAKPVKDDRLPHVSVHTGLCDEASSHRGEIQFWAIAAICCLVGAAALGVDMLRPEPLVPSGGTLALVLLAFSVGALACSALGYFAVRSADKGLLDLVRLGALPLEGASDDSARLVGVLTRDRADLMHERSDRLLVMESFAFFKPIRPSRLSANVTGPEGQEKVTLTGPDLETNPYPIPGTGDPNALQVARRVSQTPFFAGSG